MAHILHMVKPNCATSLLLPFPTVNDWLQDTFPPYIKSTWIVSKKILSETTKSFPLTVTTYTPQAKKLRRLFLSLHVPFSDEETRVHSKLEGYK